MKTVTPTPPKYINSISVKIYYYYYYYFGAYETSWVLYILSRVRGSVTSNKGFWIEWFDLLTPSFTITLYHNKFTTAHNKSSAEPLTAENSLHSRSRSTTDFCSVDFLPDNSSARTPRKTLFFCFQECVFIGRLPSNGYRSVVESVTPGLCLPSRCIAMVICVTIYIRSDQTVAREPHVASLNSQTSENECIWLRYSARLATPIICIRTIEPATDRAWIPKRRRICPSPSPRII
jgi:hypothetical protein